MLAEETPLAFCGDLTPAEILECGALVKQCTVEVGILREGICVDTAVFRSIEDAKAFLADGVWPEADEVVVLSERQEGTVADEDAGAL